MSKLSTTGLQHARKPAGVTAAAPLSPYKLLDEDEEDAFLEDAFLEEGGRSDEDDRFRRLPRFRLRLREVAFFDGLGASVN